MKYDDLPQTARDALLDKFIAEMRDEFDVIEYEVMIEFLDREDIAPLWHKYREQCFQSQLDSDDGAITWREWLSHKGIEPTS